MRQNDTACKNKECAFLDIYSKHSGPRAEDQQARQHLQRNWGTIEKLADTLSGGKYSADKAKKAAPPPQAKGTIFVDQSRPCMAGAPQPYLRISVNGRVVVADMTSGVQLHFLGQIRRISGEVRFVIATAENGFFTPLDADMHDKIADLADRCIVRNYTEEDLETDLKTRLGMA
jgi:hypothetical protein